MARQAEGFRIFKRPGHLIYSVRFRVGGARHERSTGASDPREAAKAAARIYADAVHRHPDRVAAPKRGSAPPLDRLTSTWLANDATLDPKTSKVFETYGRHWLDAFETLADVTTATATAYRDARLRVVQATTVRKELGALRRFLAWCLTHGYLPRAVDVPGVSARTLGTPHAERRRVAAPSISPAEVEAFLEALPEWSTSKRVEPFAIRARFRLQYETGLRPSTIDRLEVPEHWSPGARALTITPAIDKTRNARTVPLSKAALAALAAVALKRPQAGPLFGAHDYRPHVAAAAAKAFSPDVAAVFTGAHTRSARLTHWLEDPRGNLLATQYLAGHADLRSTSRYARQSFRAAEAMLGAFGGRPANSGDAPKRGTKRKRRNSRKKTGA